MPVYDMDAINNAPERRLKKAGVYRVEVSSVVDAPSKAGNDMLTIQLIDTIDGWKLCKDRIMMRFVPGYDESKKESALGMAKSRLKALGVPLDKPFDPQSLVGRRCWVAIRYGEPNERGDSYMEIDTRFKGSKAGYWPDSPECPVEIDESQATNLFGEADAPEPVDPTTLPMWWITRTIDRSS